MIVEQEELGLVSWGPKREQSSNKTSRTSVDPCQLLKDPGRHQMDAFAHFTENSTIFRWHAILIFILLEGFFIIICVVAFSFHHCVVYFLYTATFPTFILFISNLPRGNQWYILHNFNFLKFLKACLMDQQAVNHEE